MFFGKKLQESVFEELDKLITDDSPVIIAVSGGVDSIFLSCMLFFYYKLKYTINSIHCVIINHNLRNESSHECFLTEKNLKNLGFVNVKVLNWRHEQLHSKIEETARNVRYEMLVKYAKEHGITKIFTAHHLNDQIETFFLNSLRGSGILGLASMPTALKIDEEISLLRPLLSVTKSEIIEFCQENNISWVEDESNSSDNFTRNRLRKIIPTLFQKPEDIKKIQTTINIMQDSVEVFEDIVSNFFENSAQIASNSITLDRLEFLQQKKAIKIYIFYRIYNIFKLEAPRASQIVDVISLIDKDCSINSQKKLYLASLQIKISQNSIEFVL